MVSLIEVKDYISKTHYLAIDIDKASAEVLKKLGEFVKEDFPVQEPEKGAVLEEVGMCGVCGTDMHISKGRLPMPFPTILGHEWWGRVKALGEGVNTDWVGKPLKEGDYITTAVGSCGKCWYCRNLPGRPNLCEKMSVIGIWPSPRPWEAVGSAGIAGTYPEGPICARRCL
jgi:D-arabinose 1-dehydrogenase-like Zn-dependent alcohol dehydrogenase